eukprot:447246-Prorocentrum_minimum.AAC.1
MPNNKSMSVPLILAACGYAYTTWHTQASDQRRAQIERVNEQVKELYGPLVMCVTATKSAYDAMVCTSSELTHDLFHQLPLILTTCVVRSRLCVQQHSTDGTLETFEKIVKSDPHSSEAFAYRSWVREVFMPLNLQVRINITIVAHLLC